jgi:multidrug transporter EmrE-like cation transporter
MTWLLIGIVIASTVISDLLQAAEMKRGAEVETLSAGALGGILASLFRNWRLGLSIGAMAVSFYALLALLQRADLSVAVPATAGGSLVADTILARVWLKERVNGLRWAGAALVAAGVWLVTL